MSSDIIYYNISIGDTNPNTPESPLGTIAETIANNNLPIINNPEDYYCSIIRFSIPLFNAPLIQFLVQTPVNDINLGVYSFTIGSNGNYSDETFVIFEPAIVLPSYQIPKIGTLTQSFGTYYFLYDYTVFIGMLNKTLVRATDNYNTKYSASIVTPFFYYESATQLITLYADSTTFDQGLVVNPVEIYFNNPLRTYFKGLTYINTVDISTLPQVGLENRILINSVYGLNLKTIDSINYIATAFQYTTYAYWNFLKSIVITTAMNVNSEIFYINQSGTTQNVNYVNVLVDYIPDFAQPLSAGLGSQILSYNANSLYRMFSFNQKSPLYDISLKVNLVDNYNNLYPLYLFKGQQCNFKLMFIKKSVYTGQNMFRH